MKKIKNLFSSFANRAIVYGFLSSFFGNSIGRSIASYSLPLGLLTALVLLVGIFIVLCCVDGLLFESKDEVIK
jgi:hypothetical protein